MEIKHAKDFSNDGLVQLNHSLAKV